MTDILLIRHGQNKWVTKNRLAGWTPGVHLNEQGRQQAKELAERLNHLPIKAIYSSPLERCLETASFVARDRDLQVVEIAGIAEVRYGKWEGKKLKKLRNKRRKWYLVQHFPSRFTFPDGESFIDVQKRAIDTIEEIGNKHKKDLIVIVSHADVIKLILAHYLGVHIDLFQRLSVSPASVSYLYWEPSGIVRVVRVNDNGPLQMPIKKDNGKNGHQEGTNESTGNDSEHQE